MPDGEVALRVGPAATPSAPVAAGPALAVAPPGRVDPRSDDLEVRGVAPDGAREIGVGKADDDLAALAVLGAPPRSPVISRAGESAFGEWRSRVGVLDPDVAADPR